MPSPPFAEVWVLDFEYRAPPGCNPEVVCLVAHDLVGDRQLRLWADELVPGKPPFRVDSGALFVAYFASAEISAFPGVGVAAAASCARSLCRAPPAEERHLGMPAT